MLVASIQSRIWTSMPGVLQSFNAALCTCTVQPAINGVVTNTDGTTSALQMPVLLDCPVQFPGGGGATLTFPLAAGNEGMILFSARCIDAWWSQGFQAGSTAEANPANNPPELRMHNLSDGFFIPGLKSVPQAKVFNGSAGVDTAAVCLTSDDGTTSVRLNPASQVVNVVAPGGISLNGVTIDTNGNLVSPGTVTGTTEVVQGSGGTAIHLSTHKHTGVTTGAGESGAPAPGT